MHIGTPPPDTPLRLWVGTWNVGTGDAAIPEDSEECFRELQTFIDPSCDIYLLTLQESFSERFCRLFNSFLDRYSDSKHARIPFPQSHLGGLGDGAFLRVKYTRVAVWVREDLIWPKGAVRPLGGSTRPLGVHHGSKGSVCVKLQLSTSCVMSFVGCHLPANDISARHESLTSMLDSCRTEGSEAGQLWEHIIVVSGDLNFRLRSISPSRAAEILEQSGGAGVMEYDEGTALLTEGSIMHGYHEAPFTDASLPSYKKRGDRPVVDRAQPQWPHMEYIMWHELPWYKCGRLKSRCPSFCDRIFYKAAEGLMTPELNSYCTVHCETGSPPQTLLKISDHSPVRCTFTLRVNTKPSHDNVQGAQALPDTLPLAHRSTVASTAIGLSSPGCTAIATPPEINSLDEESDGIMGCHKEEDVIPLCKAVRSAFGCTTERIKQ